MAAKFECQRLRRAIVQTSYELHKPLQEVVKTAARSFTKTIVSIEPPSNSKAKGTEARAQGEKRITREYGRAFKPFDTGWVNYLFYLSGRAWRGGGAQRHHSEMGNSEAKWASQILAYVAAGRTSAIEKIFRDMKVKRKWMPAVTKRDVDAFRGVNTGRIRPSALFVVPPGAVAGALGTATKRVGILAGGWATAQQQAGLKVTLPAWIRRHGTRGTGSALEVGGKYTITLENGCSFIGNVSDHDRRMAWAMDVTASKMERQMDYVMKHGLKKAGWS